MIEGPGHRQNPNRPARSKGSSGFHFFCFCGRFHYPVYDHQSLNMFSTSFRSLCNIIFLRTFPGTDNSIILLQFLHSCMSPFFGIFTCYPSFHPIGISSVSSIFPIRSYSISIDVSMSALMASAGISYGLGALPVFIRLIAFLISSLSGLSQLTSKTSESTVIYGGLFGVGRFNSSSK